MREGDALSLPKGWKEVRLGDISVCQYGYTESASIEKIGPKFLRITDIVPEFINWDDVPYAKIKNEEYLKYKLNDGDIVVARTGNTTGFAKLIKGNHEAIFASFLIRFIIKDESVYKYFVGYLIQSDIFKKYVWSIVGGAAQPGANAQLLSSFKFNLPPLETQKKIASILSGYDDLIENNLKRIKILEEMAQQTYEEWFVRMRFPGHQSATINFETGLPEGWEKVKFGDWIKTSSGGTPSKKKEVEYYKNGSIPWVRTGELKNFILIDSEIKITESGLKNSSAKLFPKGTVLLAMYGNTIGETSYCAFETSTNQACCGFLVKKDYESYFIHQYLLYNKEHILSFRMGAAQENISQSIIQNIELIKPLEDILIDFGDNLKLIYDSIINLQNQNQRLREARDILLPRLMMGMIEV